MTDVETLELAGPDKPDKAAGEGWTPPNRDAVEARIDGLRRARGAALLDGLPFDVTQLSEAEAELQALDDAEAEARRRQSAAADDAQVAARAAAIKAFGKTSKK